jgi:hypothetical protein
MKVYKIPYDGKLSAYDVVKAVKKEMILRDSRGQLHRITPSGQLLHRTI